MQICLDCKDTPCKIEHYLGVFCNGNLVTFSFYSWPQWPRKNSWIIIPVREKFFHWGRKKSQEMDGVQFERRILAMWTCWLESWLQAALSIVVTTRKKVDVTDPCANKIQILFCTVTLMSSQSFLCIKSYDHAVLKKNVFPSSCHRLVMALLLALLTFILRRDFLWWNFCRFRVRIVPRLLACRDTGSSANLAAYGGKILQLFWDRPTRPLTCTHKCEMQMQIKGAQKQPEIIAAIFLGKNGFLGTAWK